MRNELAANTAMLKRLAQIDNTLFLHDSALRDLYQKLRPLLAPPPEPPPKPRIGSVVPRLPFVFPSSQDLPAMVG
jgi:hypothetical protein